MRHSIVGLLLVLGVLLGARVLSLANQPGSACNGRVVVIRAPCFSPGP
jgi:hypothetical protein